MEQLDLFFCTKDDHSKNVHGVMVLYIHEQEVIKFDIEVEAPSTGEALKIACKMYQDKPMPDNYKFIGVIAS